MKYAMRCLCALVLTAFALQAQAFARGFGAARGGYAAGPRGGYGAGGASRGVAAGPYGGVHAGGGQYGSYAGPRGTTVQAGRVGGVTQGPYGGVHAQGAEAARVTTPGGRTYTTGERGSIGAGPYGGVHAHAAGASAVSGPYGSAAFDHHGGVAVGPFGGVTAGSSRGAVATGPYGGGALGRAGGVAIGHGTRYVSPVALRNSAAYVRTGFGGSVFTPAWYRLHPAAWTAPRWSSPNFWLAPAWPGLATWCGIAALPIVYDYGGSAVIDNDNVYLDGDPVATAADYAVQAETFSNLGRQAPPDMDGDWQPLGVFGMIQGDEKVAERIFQLAINKAGLVRGNYYDAVADNTLPVYGSVDKKSQRVAWSIGDKKDIVFEAGLNNLTQDQTTALVHYGKDRTQQTTLVRLEEPQN